MVKHKIYRWAINIATTFCVLLTVASYGGHFAAPFDSLAVIRIYVCGVGLVLALLNARTLVCVLGLLFFPAAIFESVIPFYTGAGAVAETSQEIEKVTIYQKNVGFHRADQQSLSDDIRYVNADFVTLQELPAGELTPLLYWLRHDYPVQLVCEGSAGRSLAILSRHPHVSGTAICATILAKAQFNVGNQVIDVVSIHLTKPWPFPQKKQLRYLEDILTTLSETSVIGGDFNATPMMSSLNIVASLTNTTMAGPSQITFKAFGFPLALDHVFASNPALLWRRPKFGSDHYGVVAQTF